MHLLAKCPLAKCPLTKCPLAKCPLTKCPLAKCPLTKCPLAKCPLAKWALPKCLDTGRYIVVDHHGPCVPCFPHDFLWQMSAFPGLKYFVYNVHDAIFGEFR